VRNGLVIITKIFTAALIAVVSIPSAAEGSENADESFFNTYYAPPERPRPDRLYGRLIRFLDKSAELPDRVFLMVPSSESPDAVEIDETELVGIRHSEGWKRVAQGAIVPLERRAYALFRAERWAEASRAYRTLQRRNPEDDHPRVMLALCEVRRGRSEEARQILKECEDANQTLKPWLQWMERTDNLFKGEETQ